MRLPHPTRAASFLFCHRNRSSAHPRPPSSLHSSLAANIVPAECSINQNRNNTCCQVLRDKAPKEITAFGMLVSRTLDDVVALGSGVDPVLRSKLQDMAEDIASVGRDVEERQKDKLEREAEEAEQA